MAGSGSSPLSAALPDETYNEMPQEAQEALDELGEWDITTECRADYARRMSHYSTYLETNGMEGLLPEDSDVELPGKCRAHYRGSKTKYWPNRIDYHKVSFQNFRAYCAQARKTVKGGEPGATQLYSHTDIRKMKDALLYHLRIVQVPISDKEKEGMSAMLKQYKKKYAKAQENGEVSEHHATCLSTGAYIFVTGKAVADGNVFLWCWEVLQWNLCCRSVNVETIRLEHMGFSGDAFRFKFKRAKNDQGGDLDHTKHVYANPLQPATCPVLAWTVYMMVTAHERENDNGRLFQGKDKSQAQRFNKQFSDLVTLHMEELCNLGYAEKDARLSTHSFRKGVGTMLTNSPAGPAIIAVCIRMGWKLGAVLSVYLRLEKGGDQLCGRVAAMLPIESTDFGILPPHFPDPSHEDVLAAAKDTFGPLWEDQPHLRANFVVGLASMVYHRVWLVKSFGGSAGSSIQACAALSDASRLARLAALVTTEPTTVMPAPSGVPPHTNILVMLGGVREQLARMQESFDTLPEKIAGAVTQHHEANAAANGVVTTASMTAAVQGALALQQEAYSVQLRAAIALLPTRHSTGAQQTSMSMDPPAQQAGPAALKWGSFPSSIMQRHCTQSSLFDCPDNFVMLDPTTTLYFAFRLWVLGNACYPAVDPGFGIRPYRRLIKTSFGPTQSHFKKTGVKLKSVYPAEWTRISKCKAALTKLRNVMSVFEAAVNAANGEDVDETDRADLGKIVNVTDLDNAFTLGLERLKTYISHAWDDNAQGRPGQRGWVTIEQYLKPSDIAEHGNEADCKNLAARLAAESGFEKNSQWLKKHSLSLAQYEELENGMPPKKKKKGGQEGAGAADP